MTTYNNGCPCIQTKHVSKLSSFCKKLPYNTDISEQVTVYSATACALYFIYNEHGRVSCRTVDCEVVIFVGICGYLWASEVCFSHLQISLLF